MDKQNVILALETLIAKIEKDELQPEQANRELESISRSIGKALIKIKAAQTWEL